MSSSIGGVGGHLILMWHHKYNTQTHKKHENGFKWSCSNTQMTRLQHNTQRDRRIGLHHQCNRLFLFGVKKSEIDKSNEQLLSFHQWIIWHLNRTTLSLVRLWKRYRFKRLTTKKTVNYGAKRFRRQQKKSIERSTWHENDRSMIRLSVLMFVSFLFV